MHIPQFVYPLVHDGQSQFWLLWIVLLILFISIEFLLSIGVVCIYRSGNSGSYGNSNVYLFEEIQNIVYNDYTILTAILPFYHSHQEYIRVPNYLPLDNFCYFPFLFFIFFLISHPDVCYTLPHCDCLICLWLYSYIHFVIIYQAAN